MVYAYFMSTHRSLEKELEQERNYRDTLYILMQDLGQDELDLEHSAQRALQSLWRLTGADRGGVFLYDDQGIHMVAHHCATPCRRCNLLEVGDIVNRTQEAFSLSVEEGAQASSFILHEPLKNFQGELPATCPPDIHSYLNASCYYQGKRLLELILINAKDGFSDGSLPWMEKILLLCKEIFLKRQMQISLESARKEVIDVNKEKAQFLANVSHEIRSPLNGVICMSSLLMDTELDEEQQELVNIIQFSASNITRIIQDLLDLTQISTGKMRIRCEEFSLQELMGGLIQNFQSDSLEKGLDFQYSIEDNLAPFWGDSVRIGQIVSNLVTNAIKYTDQGKIFLDIRIEEKMLKVVVSDTGVGIPEENQSSVFDQFVQLHSGEKRAKKGGVGLGLAIVKQLVDLMGGMIELRSRVGRGSTFTVNIPAGSSEEDLPVVVPQENADKKSDVHRILIAEDDDINRLYLKTFLGRQGFIIDEAENGLIAVDMCKANPYDLVLMDVSMPQMDGIQATAEIRQFAPKLPIIAVTAHAYEEDQRKVRKSGMNGIVLKPIDEKDLKSTIQNILG